MSVRSRVVGFAARSTPSSVLVSIKRRPLLGRLANRVLPPGTQVLQILHGPVAGAMLELDVTREKAFWLGVHEPEIASVIQQEASGTSWDIGAHLGYFSLLMARRCELVVAVEANPHLAARLRRNVELNNAGIAVVEVAVAGNEGTVTFEISSETGMSRVAELGGVASAPIVDRVRVETTTLDRLLEIHERPSFAKLDIEGAELAALENAPRFLAARPVIVCDLHGDAAHREVPKLLRAAEYDVEFFQPSCVLARPVEARR